MSESHSTKRITKQLTGEVSEYLIKLTTPWIPGFGATADQLRILTEMRSLSGGARHKAAWRTADVIPDYPGTWTLGTARTADGIYCEDFTPGTQKVWVQAGIAMSTSGTPGDALMSLTASLKNVGEILAVETLNLEPDLNASQTAYYPLGRLWRLQSCSHLLFAFLFTGVSGTITYQPAWRSCNRFDAPSAWTDLGSSANATSDGPVAGSALAITEPSPVQFYGQAGLKVTATGRGTIRVYVAGRF